MKELLNNYYKNKRVLITGGLGFIGSNIAQKLVPLGAQITILDSLHPLYGGNHFNIENIKNEVKVVIGDIRDEPLINDLVKNQDIIFNLAAQVSYIDSSNMPLEDLDVNCRGHLIVLEACRKHNKNAKIVFSSSRLVLGKIIENPVTENHPASPLSLYGIHKLKAEKYYLMYYKDYGIRSTILRITNPYGERQQIKHSKYSIPGWFMRLAMENQTIQIFGDGGQLRDYIYIDDLVKIFLLIAATESSNGQIFNCASGISTPFKKMAEMIVKITGKGNIKYVPWPDNYEKNETGSVETDISKLIKIINWRPETEMEEGLKKMYEYYSQHKDKYIN